MTISTKELVALKAKVDAAKNETISLTGQLELLNKQLKTKWECDSIKQADKKLKKMDTDLSAMDDQIEEGKKELEEKYGDFLDG